MKQDISGLKIRWNDGDARRWKASGEWSDLTISDRARALASTEPDFVTHKCGDVSLTAAQAWSLSCKLAGALVAQGYRAGDILAFMTPSWYEAVLIDLAASMLGVVVCPIVPIYRDREVQLILSDSRAKGIFIVKAFRNFDYLDMMTRLRPSLPELQHVWTVRGERGSGQDLTELLEMAQPLTEPPRVSPDTVKIVLYTSGTTGHPKAVLHTHNSLSRYIDYSFRYWGIKAGDTSLMPSPVTHVTGYGFGIEAPFFHKCCAILMEKWDAAQAADIIEREQVCFSVAATPFLTELMDLAERQGRRLPSLRLFPCGGAAVPPELIHRASRVFENCRAFRTYGSSECPLITYGFAREGQERLSAETDGEVVDYEVKIVDADGRRVGVNEEGEICARGPSQCVGYANVDDTAASFDEEGFFHTGDVGIRTPEGAIVFTGRIKDLINRGGEKISAKEVEDLLHTHPGVLQAAVVAMPHHRLGETVCAYLIVQSGAEVTLEQVSRTLDAAGVAKQKYPERVFVVDDFPRTASGKVKKDLLRLDVKQRLQQAS